MRIGIVDSGVGGLTTTRCVMQLVNAEYYYYMDNAHVPYGTKRQAELESIARNTVCVMNSIGVDIIVVACNTLSAVVGEYMRSITDIPIVLTEPAIRMAHNSGGTTIVLATPMTVSSKRFGRLINRYDDVIVKSSTTLATYVEENNMDKAKDELSVQLAGKKADNVVLGCTHYVYLKEYVESLGYKVFEGNDGVARRTESIAIAQGTVCNNTAHSTLFLHATSRYDYTRIAHYLGCPVMLY